MRLDIEDYKALRRPIGDPVTPEAKRRGCPEQYEDRRILTRLGWPCELTMDLGAINMIKLDERIVNALAITWSRCDLWVHRECAQLGLHAIPERIKVCRSRVHWA